MTVSEQVVCQQCGVEYHPSDELRGQCPSCLMQRAMYNSESDPQYATRDHGDAHRFHAPKINELDPLFPQLEILELIGHGGMGAVYKARQPTLNRVVALKVLPRDAGTDPKFAERFAREARALASLSHPNIVALHDFGETDGLFYFVMEYIDGVNLRQALERGSFSPSEALEIVPKICDALQYAHEESIVHRDIKPENILLDKRGRMKIADFGLAKLLTVTGEGAHLTATRQVVGTPHYMAPEQVERPLEVDHRADIYSLGVVFYEMLTGELPIGRFEPPSQKVQVDVRLDAVVLRALAKEPAQRYQRVSDVKSGIDTITQSAPRWHSWRAELINRRAELIKRLQANREWVRGLAWGPWRPKEVFLAVCSWAALGMGMAALSGAGHDDMEGLAIPVWIISFVLARILVGWAKNWHVMSFAQFAVLPPLVAGYGVILAVMLLWPACMIGALGAAPAVLDIDRWYFFDYEYVEPGRTVRLPYYWLTVACTCAAATALWCVLLSLFAKKRPAAFSLIFHPADESTIAVVATYVMVIALFTLGPVALTLVAILAMG